MKFLVYVLLIGFACVASAQVATKLRLKSAGSALYATIGGAEKKITDVALKAWMIEGGRQVLYSSRDGAGGYEDEGQSLHLYDASTGMQRKILSEYFIITGVEELKTSSGKTSLLVTMIDGGLGASHLAVVDPRRGEVFSADGAEFVNHSGGAIVVGWYQDEDWDKLRANHKLSPFKTERYDVDELLQRSVIVNKTVR
jgi:hypothetical protein